MGDQLTPEQLAAIEARCERATPGPWRWDDRDDQLFDAKGELLAFGQPTYEGNHGIVVPPDDATFIAAARTDVPALLAEVRRLQSDLALADQTAAAQLAEVRRLTAEVECMRPIVDAAIAFRVVLLEEDADCWAEDRALWSAVDAYRKAKP